MEFHLDADLPKVIDVDLRAVLGACKAGTMWNGQRVMFFPPPFGHVRIVDGERIRGPRRTELLEALAFFAGRGDL